MAVYALLVGSVSEGADDRDHLRNDAKGRSNCMKLTGAQILWECLCAKVTEIRLGGAILPAYDAMLDYPIRHTLVRHEQGPPMADGYACATGRVGVAIATPAPARPTWSPVSPPRCWTRRRSSASRAVGSRLIGTDAFQRSTSPASPCRSPSTTTSSPGAGRRRGGAGSLPDAGGWPGPALIDITKDAQQSTCEFDWDAAAPVRRARRETLSPARFGSAAELIQPRNAR
jgi:acetolactate synthase-1/2/3 large subunit